ncbi:energy-coupling factor transporter transmembrane component T family protein [Candidatus Poribacteria bacterium]
MPSFTNINIGRYYHRDSPVHRLDPRTKLLALVILIVSIFLVRANWGFLIIASFVTGAIFLAHLPLRLVLRGLRPMIWLLVSIMLLHILFTGDGFRPTWPGVYNGLRVGCRFLLIVAGATVLTLTTMPLRLADGMARILRPLRKIGLPVHQLPIMMVVVLHFIPMLFAEAEKLMLAQKARGAQVYGRNVFKKLRAVMPILVPLLRVSFQQADELAMGMESRCYHGGVRTHLHELVFGKADRVALAVAAIMLSMALVVNGIT